MASRSRARGFIALAVTLATTCACAKSRDSKPAPSAKPAVTASAMPGVTPELGRLIELSKAKLAPDERRARLTAVLEKFPADHTKEREDLIVAAVARGAHDPIEWTTITSNYQGRRAQIQVTKDALTVLGVRIDVTADGAQRIADDLHAILPTPRILQLIWEQADVRLEPCTLPADAKMATTARMIQHSKCVDDRIAGRKGLVANEGKHWVLTNRIAGKANLAANYGWFIKGRRPIQTVGTRHDTAHTDYSQIVRLMKPVIKLDGRDIDIRGVGRSPELWGLVSDEGPLLVWRASRPDETSKMTEKLVELASKAQPGDPKTVRLTLKPEGSPIGVDQLPATTTALRRTTVARRLLSSLRMRPEDVPEEAYWSAGASACGGRDIFFELMNETGVDGEELGRTLDTIKQSLSCGKALTPQIRAGIGVYQVEYDYESAPSGFAMLRLSDDSFREKLVYPGLTPTPVGVHRAYCNDDEGAPRSACQDGARARLLLAVNNGYLTAYAREVPSLLETLGKAHPPPPKVAELAAFFIEATQPEEVAVAQGGSCAFAVDFSLLELSADETSRQRVLDAVNDNALLCGTLSSGSVIRPTRRLVFVAKDEAAAQIIAAALKRRALEASNEAVATAQKAETQTEFDKARHSVLARAARAAKPELVKNRLSVTVAFEPNAAELSAMSTLFDERRAASKRAAAIIRNLAAGKQPSREELETFRAHTGTP
jgi:hypothetical protein